MKAKEIIYKIGSSVNKVIISKNIEKKILRDLTQLKSDKKIPNFSLFCAFSVCGRNSVNIAS